MGKFAPVNSETNTESCLTMKPSIHGHIALLKVLSAQAMDEKQHFLTKKLDFLKLYGHVCPS